MAKKQPAPALFTVKHDFVASLDAFLQEAVNLIGILDMHLELGGATGPTADRLKEQVAKFKAALFSDD